MKKRILLFLILGLLLSVVSAARFVAPRAGYSFDVPALQAEEAGKPSYDAENILLQKGIYTVEVPYECKDYAMAIVQVDGQEFTAPMRGTIFTFFPEKDFLSFRLYIDAPELNTHFRFFPTAEDSAFRPLALNITYRRTMTMLYYALRVFLCFCAVLLAGIFVYLFVRRWDNRTRFLMLGLIAVFLIINLPFYQNFYPHGHDTNFHMLRVEYIGEGLRAGDFPVRMQTGWFNDYGLPVGVYYPDFFLYPAAFLYLCGIPLWTSYRFYGIYMNLLMIPVSYFSFQRIAKDKEVGFFATALYALSVRYFTNTYPRGAAGEASAMIFLPLIALGLVSIAREKYKEGGIALALGITGVMQCHVISVRMVLVFCVVTCLACGKTFFHKNALLTVFASALGTLALNAGFIVPFLSYFLSNKIEATGSNEIFATSGIALKEVFLKDGELCYSPGWSVGVILLFALWLIAVRKRDILRKGFCVSLFVGILSVYMSMSAFPYDALQRVFPLSDALIGSFMRLKNRYLSISAVAFAVLSIYVLTLLKEQLKARKNLWLVLCLLMLVLAVAQNVLLSTEYIRGAERMTPYSSAGITPYPETLYVYDDVDLHLINDSKVHEIGAGVTLKNVERRGLSFTLAAENAGSETGALDLPVWHYPGYTARNASGEVLPLSNGENHRVRVSLPAGFSGSIRVRFEEPLLWRAAEFVSLCSVLAGLVLLVRRK